jgi:hypothetical protein
MAQKKSAKKKSKGVRGKSPSANMIADRFDDRTLANMEVALERACEHLRGGREDHEARRYLAQNILECAEGGDHTLTGLTEAGRVAATKLAKTRAK